MERNWPAACLGVFTIVVISLLTMSCESYRAKRQLESALRLEDQGRTEELIERLRDVEKKYPDTDSARRAAKMRPLYEGLLAARERFPVRQALDVLRQTARAIESYRERSGSLPPSLQTLVPGELPSNPSDPWGNRLQYQVRGSHYGLTSLGADATPGGSGENMDLHVEDGRLSLAPSWAER